MGSVHPNEAARRIDERRRPPQSTRGHRDFNELLETGGSPAEQADLIRGTDKASRRQFLTVERGLQEIAA
jgi:hypothetical protein